MRLHEALQTHRARVLQSWTAMVQGEIVPEAMPHIELVNHLPRFVDEVVAALRAEAGLPTSIDPPEQTETASGHGEQRLRLGFSLDSVVREYGALRDAILATALEAGAEITFAELNCVFRSTITGIAQAVSEYARQRDAEQQRQHNEHIAFIAHELRNPLGSALLAHEVLTEQGHLPKGSRAASALARGLTSMGELIDHSLSVARTASGVELRREPVELRALFTEVELAAAGEAEGRDVTLHVELDGEVTIDGDRRLLRSAFSNIVRNAVKYTRRSTAVTVRCRVDGKRAVIEIEDCCGGLPDGMTETAFAPFVRLTSRASGSGLGLAIAKQSIDAHGGAIRVQNLPGKGCIFVLELPLERPEHSAG